MDFVIDESPKTYKRIKIWSDDDTQLLLDLYAGYLFQIGPMKKFQNKKEMWAKISNQFPDKSARQCEERYKTVLRRKTPLTDSIDIDKRLKEINYMTPEPEVQIKVVNDEETLWKISEKTEAAKDTYKRIKIWSDDDTQLLLDLYAGYLFQIGPTKKFQNKKEMWAQISTQFPDKSAKQCEERYKTVLRRKSPLIDGIDTGKKLNEINYMTLEPEVQIKIVNDEENNECTKTTLTVQETLWKIAEKTEAAKERRHKEKMQAMEKMNSLLQKILEEREKGL